MAKATVTGEIAGTAKGFVKATEEASAAGSKFGGLMSGLAAGLGLGLFNAASSAVMGLVDQVKASDQIFRADQTSIALMKTALQNTIPHWDGNTAAIEKMVAQQAQWGFSADEVRDSLAKLSGVTHDVALATNSVGIAENLARAKHMSLAEATTIVTKAHEGNAKALKSLGIEVTTTSAHVDALKASTGQHTVAQLKAAEAADKHENAQRALQAIMDNTKGSIVAYANTSEGKLAAAQAKTTAAWVKIGAIVDRVSSVVIPAVAEAFSQLASKIDPFLNFLSAHADVIRSIGIGLGVVGVVIMALLVPSLIAAAIAGWAAVAPWLPLILILVAVGAVVAALAYAWQHNMFDIQGKTHAVVDWIKNAFNDVVEFVKKLPGRIADGARGLWDGLASGFKSIYNMIAGDLNHLIDAFNALPHLGAPNMPRLPTMDTPGVVPGPPGSRQMVWALGGEHFGGAQSIGSGGRGGDMHFHFNGSVYADGPGLDTLTLAIAQRLRMVTGI